MAGLEEIKDFINKFSDSLADKMKQSFNKMLEELRQQREPIEKSLMEVEQGAKQEQTKLKDVLIENDLNTEAVHRKTEIPSREGVTDNIEEIKPLQL